MLPGVVVGGSGGAAFGVKVTPPDTYSPGATVIVVPGVMNVAAAGSVTSPGGGA
jgi:hypothetical protein